MLNNRFNLFVTLLFCNLFINLFCIKAYSKDKNLYDLLDKTINQHQIKYLKNDSILTIKSDLSNSIYLYFNKDVLKIIKDSSENIKSIIVNDNAIDTVRYGNNHFFGNFENMDIDPFNIDLTEIGSRKYFIIPMNIKDCIGSFCRASMNLLIEIKENLVNGYFFSNSEIQRNTFFMSNENGNLLFLNITNSFSNYKDFKEYKNNNYQNFLLYKISILEFNSENWLST